MGLQPFYGKGPHPLLWAGSLATRENIMSGIPSRQNYGFFIVHAQFTNVAAGRGLDTIRFSMTTNWTYELSKTNVSVVIRVVPRTCPDSCFQVNKLPFQSVFI